MVAVFARSFSSTFLQQGRRVCFPRATTAGSEEGLVFCPTQAKESVLAEGECHPGMSVGPQSSEVQGFTSTSPSVFPIYPPTQPPYNLPGMPPSTSPTPEVAEAITGIADPKNEMANFKHIGQSYEGGSGAAEISVSNNNNETQEEGMFPSIKGTEATARIADPKNGTANSTIASSGQPYEEESGAADTSVPSNDHNTQFGSREKGAASVAAISRTERQGGSGATAFLSAAVVVVVTLTAVDYRRQQRLEAMLFHRELCRLQEGLQEQHGRELAQEEGNLSRLRPPRRFSKGTVRRQLKEEKTGDKGAGGNQFSSGAVPPSPWNEGSSIKDCYSEGLSQTCDEETNSDIGRFDPGTAPSSFAYQGSSILELSRQPSWRLSGIEGTGTIEDDGIVDIAKLDDREKKTALEIELSQSTRRLLDSFHEYLDASGGKEGATDPA